MFRISQKMEYALRAMVELSLRREGGRLVPAREIAEAHQIPLRFLEQQLGALHKAGLVESFRGAGGGCRLSRDPAEISVAQVFNAIEGPLYPMMCLEPEDHTCFADERCGLQTLWGDVQKAVIQVLERMTMADLTERHKKLQAGARPFFTADDLLAKSPSLR
jgi:Rrf2 family protein